MAEKHQHQQVVKQRWLPLEGTPEVLGPYLLALGGPQELQQDEQNQVAVGKGAPLLQFEDLLAVEPWAFDVLECTDIEALLLLFPIISSDEEEKACVPLPEDQQQHDEELKKSVWFVKQTVPNACGTVAVLHCTANLPRDKYPLHPNGFLESFFRDTWPKDPATRGAELESSKELASLHLHHQEAGETNAEAAANTDTHFTCLLPWRGYILELDGRKPKPILRAKIQPNQTFSEAAAEVIRSQFIEPRGEDMRFSLLAIGDARSTRN